MHTNVCTEDSAWMLWISENPSGHYLTESGTQYDPLVEGLYQMYFMAEKPNLRDMGIIRAEAIACMCCALRSRV